jgi:hypothetical protein
MKKEVLVQQLQSAKSLSSTVDIDKVIELINQIEPEVKTGLTQELADEICNQIELCLDNNSDDLVDKDNITFEITYGNQLQVDEAQIDNYEVMRHISDVLSDFIIEEVKEEQHTIPGFENGSGINQVTIY